jgi:hypothetical protein
MFANLQREMNTFKKLQINLHFKYQITLHVLKIINNCINFFKKHEILLKHNEAFKILYSLVLSVTDKTIENIFFPHPQIFKSEPKCVVIFLFYLVKKLSLSPLLLH